MFGWHFSQGVLETLGNQLGKLEDEIKADEAGKHEFERQLTQVVGLLLSRSQSLGSGSMNLFVHVYGSSCWIELLLARTGQNVGGEEQVSRRWVNGHIH